MRSDETATTSPGDPEEPRDGEVAPADPEIVPPPATRRQDRTDGDLDPDDDLPETPLVPTEPVR